jgi:MobA/VirD2-like, nuclease domain
VIPHVSDRGTRVGGLLRYLFGPGKRNEHTNPRIVGAWNGAGDLASLAPPVGASGRLDFRRLVELLEQPVQAARHAPAQTVWHTSLRNHAQDRILSDEQGGHIAAELMAGVGLAPHGDTNAVRWVAVRHDDYGIHVVATLVRQDGRTAWAWKDKTNSRRVAKELEDRYGLRATGPSDRTSHRPPSPKETSKAARLGRALTTRDELRRRVRAVVAASLSEEEFFARLADDGVLVKLRPSQTNPDEITGYAVGLPAERDKAGEPVWFSASHLAADLSLPKLRIRWGTATPHSGGRGAGGETVRVSAAQRAQTLTQAAATVTAAADEIRRVAGSDPQAAQALAQAAADTLTGVASTVEGRRGGPLSEAAERFDKAARAGYAKVARGTSRSYELRAMARLVRLMGHISGDEDTFALLALVLDLARLGDTLAWWRRSQDAWHQAEAARDAAEALRAWHATGAPATPRPAATATVPTDTTPPQQQTAAAEQATARRRRTVR